MENNRSFAPSKRGTVTISGNNSRATPHVSGTIGSGPTSPNNFTKHIVSSMPTFSAHDGNLHLVSDSELEDYANADRRVREELIHMPCQIHEMNLQLHDAQE